MKIRSESTKNYLFWVNGPLSYLECAPNCKTRPQLKKITITNIWHSTPISTFDSLSKWHEPDICLITLNWKSFLLIAGLEIHPKTSRDLFELFVFFNLYMTSVNTWRLCTNHGWFWIQFTVNCAFEIMIKISVIERSRKGQWTWEWIFCILVMLCTTCTHPSYCQGLTQFLGQFSIGVFNPFWFFELKFHTWSNRT
jgi:hypothetical protein